MRRGGRGSEGKEEDVRRGGRGSEKRGERK